jgi:hypothetical protein
VLSKPDEFRNGIKAITAAGRILEALAEAHRPVAFREIATSSTMGGRTVTNNHPAARNAWMFSMSLR